MSTYLVNAACKGYPPKHLAAARHRSRPDLTARLLRERQVVRFVVAPGGFGKTALILEYAQTVYGYRHVFWIDARSPCFLRDLDRAIIAETLLSADSERFLAVIEDVPLLNAQRVEALSRSFDALLDRGCEVVVTCTPLCDAFGRLQHDRLKLTARDLLLSDAELDGVRTSEEKASLPASKLPAAQRVAGIRWAPAGEARAFAQAVFCEELPSDILLAAIVALVLQEGCLADIDAFGPCGTGTVSLLAENYPYVGIDRKRDVFEAVRLPIEDLVDGMEGNMEGMVSCSRFASRDALVSRLADILVTRSSAHRACLLMGMLGSLQARAAWLADHGCDLLDASCVLPAVELYGSLRGGLGSAASVLSADQSARLLVLGDDRCACQLARRPLGDVDAPEAARATAALVLFRGGSGDARTLALSQLAMLADDLGDGAAGRTDPLSGEIWKPLARMAVACDRSPTLAAATWCACLDAGVDCRALLLGASWILKQAISAKEGGGAHRPDGGTPPLGDDGLARVAAYVRERGDARAPLPCGLFEAMAGVTLERACECGAVDVPPPHAKASLAMHRVEVGLFVQRSAYERVARERADQRRGFVLTHPDSFRAEAGLRLEGETLEPLLTVNLFGGLDVRIGDAPVDPRCFRRQKVKTLLALLVLNRGREFSRDALVQLLWPESTIESARKNFYGIWSLLRRALVTPAGICPYLIRQQNGLRLDGRLLVTDVAQLESLCRALQLEHPGSGGWAALLSQVNERFSDDLLPSECDNEHIMRRRVDYRNRLVDALVSASNRLIRAGDVQEGLWFARTALVRDHTREDAYTALMNAQLAVGQRTAALETYFSCRRFLADELGIDPSLETMGLYHAIIETEEALR